MSSVYDVIVVGVGSMGASTCFRLARRGVHVLGLEQGPLPNPEASFTGATRAIRLSYSEHPDYVPLLMRAYELWEEIGEIVDRDFLHLTGAVYMGLPDGETVAGACRSAKTHGLAHALLTHAELSGRWPQFRLPETFVGLHEERAGYLLSEEAVAAYVEQALLHGADLRGNHSVIDWQMRPGGITVRTEEEEFHARHVVFTAGAWTSKLLRGLGVELSVTRQVLGWLSPRKPELFTADKFPVWLIEGPGSKGVHYGFPLTLDGSGGVGLKGALHFPSKPTHPDEVDRSPLPGDAEEVSQPFEQYIPDGCGPLLSTKVCLYTNSPDGHFIVDRHPEYEEVTIACGFSGHGFKFASVMGEVLADLSTSGKTSWPIDFLSLSRFAS